MPPKKTAADKPKLRNLMDEVDKDLLPKAHNPNKDLHGFDLPARDIIIAPSGSGKTNFIVCLIKLFCQRRGTFSDITIVTANADEILYNQLKRDCKDISIVEGIHKLPPLDKFDKKEQHLVIVDDLVLENQTGVANYFVRCRKQNVSIFFISQSYYDINKLIRKNATDAIFMDIGTNRDLSGILSEYSLGVDLDVMKNMYHYVKEDEFVPFIITRGGDHGKTKFRKGLDEVLNPEEFE